MVLVGLGELIDHYTTRVESVMGRGECLLAVAHGLEDTEPRAARAIASIADDLVTECEFVLAELEAMATKLQGGLLPAMLCLPHLFGKVASIPELAKGGQSLPAPLKAKLTERELEIATLALSGRSGAEISKMLSISPRAVEVYLARLDEKLSREKLSGIR